MSIGWHENHLLRTALRHSPLRPRKRHIHLWSLLGNGNLPYVGRNPSASATSTAAAEKNASIKKFQFCTYAALWFSGMGFIFSWRSDMGKPLHTVMRNSRYGEKNSPKLRKSPTKTRGIFFYQKSSISWRLLKIARDKPYGFEKSFVA